MRRCRSAVHGTTGWFSPRSKGEPATFELTRPGSDEVTYAEAGKLLYDLADGTIEFSENATITEGGNQISSSFLVYNIAEQRINAQSSGDPDNKVKITYTPPPADDEPPQQDVEQATDESGRRHSMSILSVQDISKSYKLRKVVKGMSRRNQER